MIERRLHKFQFLELQRELKSGKVYAVRGRERTDNGIEMILIEGKPKKDAIEARRCAWVAAKEWLAEIGPVREFDKYFISTCD